MNVQERALDKWETQKAEWAAAARRLAAKVGKKESEVLQNMTHQWRERGEALEILTASVPQEARSSDGWQMSLRNRGDGVRYVKFGTSYPYPLYCPIPNKDGKASESNIHMKVITGLPPAKQPLSSTSQYYKSREKQYRPHIVKKFPHRGRKNEALMEVAGEPAPRTAEKIDGEVTSGVQLFEFVAESQAGEEPEGGGGDASAVTDPSASTLSVSNPSCPPEPQGPLLLLAADRLSFSATPSEISHRSLKVANLGTTAIFYCWQPLPGEALQTSKGELLPMAQRPYKFVLPEAHSGVLLPGAERQFPFSFRSITPCVASEQWELQTVPSGKDRITINLRGSCVAKEHNPLSVAIFNDLFTKRSTGEMVAGLLTEILTKPGEENAFTKSDKASKLKSQKTQADHDREASLASAENERSFYEENGRDTGLSYTDEMFSEFAGYWAAAGRGGDKWNGSLADLQSAIDDLPRGEKKEKLLKSFDNTYSACRMATPSHLSAAFSRMLCSLVSDIPLMARTFSSPRPPPGKDKANSKAAAKKPPQQPPAGAVDDPTGEKLTAYLTGVVRERLSAGVVAALTRYEAAVEGAEAFKDVK